MIEQDTIKLLRECDAGIKMGTASIEDVQSHVKSKVLKDYLSTCKIKHDKLKSEIKEMLAKYHDEGKAPNPFTKAMSWMKTKFELWVNKSDQTIAHLMTDGCNMGVKSLNKYLNQYNRANEESKEITKKLIDLEEQLVIDIRRFL